MRTVGDCDAWDLYEEVKISFERFQDAVRAHGWHHGHEETLFDALSKDQSAIVAEDMRPAGR